MGASHNRGEGPGGSELSSEAYERFSIYLGVGKADEVANDVRSGEMSADDAEAWSRTVEESHENSRHRPDIAPQDWQAFEEGWRPEGRQEEPCRLRGAEIACRGTNVLNARPQRPMPRGSAERTKARRDARQHLPVVRVSQLAGEVRSPVRAVGQFRLIPCPRLSRASFQTDSRCRIVSDFVLGSKISRMEYWKLPMMRWSSW